MALSITSATTPVDSSPQLEASVTFGGHVSPSVELDADVRRIGLRSGELVPRTREDLLAMASSSHLWVSITLNEGSRIRPLAQVVGVSEGTLRLRWRHLFPNDRRALEAWHGAV